MLPPRPPEQPGSPAKQFSHDIASWNTLGECVSVSTVCTVDGIFASQICTDADGYGFFAHVQMHEAWYL